MSDVRSAEWVADWASSGVMALTGRPEGPPLVPPGSGATMARQLAERLPFDVDGPALLAERAAYTAMTRQGAVSPGGRCRLLPTADGWAAVSCARADDPALLGALIGIPIEGDPWPAVTAWLAEHAGAELAERAELLGIAAAPVSPPGSCPAGPPWGPVRTVDGALVVDFSALWAGPLCANLLGLAGARVVKVEIPSRLDGARLGDAEFYRMLHGGHRSVLLDPATVGGRAALAGLVAAADFVIEASRPRALAGFGLDAAAAVAGGATWVSITAAGRVSNRIGFGDDVAAGAGLVAVDPGGVPLFCGDAIADPLAGLTAAARALTSPPGTLVEIAMADVVAGTLEPVSRTPARAARRGGDGWVVDTGAGPVDVRRPRPRPAPHDAPEPGADTVAVLHELGIRLP